MAFELGERVTSSWTGPGTIIGLLTRDEENVPHQMVRVDKPLFGKTEVLRPIAKLQPYIDPTPKRVAGEWSTKHLSFIQKSFEMFLAEYDKTQKPIKIGSGKWSRRVYKALGIGEDGWSSTVSTFPGYLERDGYVKSVSKKGGYVPTDKRVWSGLRNRLELDKIVLNPPFNEEIQKGGGDGTEAQRPF